MAKRDPADKRRFVIIGGGAAGLTCAETLRQSNYTGEITVISNESYLPYDRTLLSKALPMGDASKFELRSSDFLNEHDIDFKLKSRAWKIDPANKTVRLTTGKLIPYDKLCIASGSKPNVPKIEGIDSKNVHVLRTRKNQEDIKALVKDAKSIVVLGSSFIGSEAAGSVKSHVKDEKEVHLIGGSKHPMERIFGEEIGKMYTKQHTEAGVKMHMENGIQKVVAGEDKKVKKVILKDGTELDCDVLIVGCGVKVDSELF
jgi:NAD(P)H-nitrite reductase large subunit